MLDNPSISDNFIYELWCHTSGVHDTPPIPGLPYTKTHDMPDIDTLLYVAQTRMAKLLELGYEYDNMLMNSDIFLHNNALHKIRMAALFVDLVSSTRMSQMLPGDKLAMLIGSFVQEMAHVIVSCGGMVLKYVGDAAIGYFVTPQNPQVAAVRSIRCGQIMFDVISRGINPVLERYRYPPLHARVGMDYGENTVIVHGGRSRISHADLIGNSMNMAAKIQTTAGHDQIAIGRDLYVRLPPGTRQEFKVREEPFPYNSIRTGKPYRVYVHSPSARY